MRTNLEHSKVCKEKSGFWAAMKRDWVESVELEGYVPPVARALTWLIGASLIPIGIIVASRIF